MRYMGNMTPKIIGETKDYIWLYKPAGLPVFTPHDDPTGDSLSGWLLDKEPAQAGFEAGFAAGIAHRLDNSTSGLMVACRSKKSLSLIRDMFGQGQLSKRYLFVPRDDPEWSENHVITRLAHHKRRKSRMVYERGRETPHRGKWYPADTVFEREKNGCWSATITTGVMHQIRVHAASIGLALAGDKLYGGGDGLDGLPKGVDFALHHVGLRGINISSPEVEIPRWWIGL
jgi:23S rRNA-/tRNA-specific pseudouridylate synthase